MPQQRKCHCGQCFNCRQLQRYYDNRDYVNKRRRKQREIHSAIKTIIPFRQVRAMALSDYLA
jgi:hypothetical protein